jgi:diacylglycerol O-acyltransferase
MKQLSGMDATFLHVERDAQFGHVSGLQIFARPGDPGYDPQTAWRAQLEQRLHLLEPLRRRVVTAPVQLDHPYWLDTSVNLDFHVRHATLPRPGRDDQLEDLVGRIIAQPLDRRRPLWLSYVIEGLSGNSFAILIVIHHATIDGGGFMELLQLLLGSAPTAEPHPRRTVPARRSPGPVEMLARGVLGLAGKPVKATVVAARSARHVGWLTFRRASLMTAAHAAAVVSPPPPRTAFNRALTPHRNLAIRSVSLDAVKAIKTACGTTVNDVVLAACSGGLRRWLQLHESLPNEPLVALVPVSARTDADGERWTNRIAMVMSSLPTNEPDAVERVRRAHNAMSASKELLRLLGPQRFAEAMELQIPVVTAPMLRLAQRLGLRARLSPVNLIISNVPGPREPLHLAGAPMLHCYPGSMITEGHALNITVHSYTDQLDFGAVSCPELMPDIAVLLDAIIGEIETLSRAVERTREPRRARSRRHLAVVG